jgi:CDP-diacylglycerol--glycerol-3-phosphate 3-phosphatidyltransferase
MWRGFISACQQPKGNDMMSIDSIPNWMTVLRIAVTPIIAIMIWIDDTSYGYLVAFILFTIASITDYLDGMLARQMKIESGFGEMLDPIADKMLIGAVLLALASVQTSGWLFLVPALAILSREFMISGLREYLAKVSFSVPVTRLAKWKTTVQILALGTLIGAPAFPSLTYAHDIGLMLLWVAALLTLQTGMGYIIAGLRHVPHK